MAKPKYKLGWRVKDKVTGFQGSIIRVHEYLYGCCHYGVMPTTKEDNPKGEFIEAQSLDELQLELVEERDDKRDFKYSGAQHVELGVTAEDMDSVVSGFLMAKYYYSTGRITYHIQPKSKELGEKYPEGFEIESVSLRVIEDGPKLEGYYKTEEMFDKDEDEDIPPGGPELYSPGSVKK